MPPDDIEKDREKLFNLLLKNAFFKEKIVLSSGKESDYYIDARRVTLTSEGAYLAANLILNKISENSFDAIGGPTLGADPLVGAIALIRHQTNKPINTFIIRKSPKAHGKQQSIEGPLLKKGAKVILIDDVTTTGKALLESLDVLAASGIKAEKAVCLVDREEGAKKALAEKNCELTSIFKAKEFLSAHFK